MSEKTVRNAEHFEAEQAKANKEREELKLKMNPRQLEMMEAIESAVGILTKAKVPFYMCGGIDGLRATAAGGEENGESPRESDFDFIKFYELTYLERYTPEDDKLAISRAQKLAFNDFHFLSGVLGGAKFAAFGPENNAYGFYYLGKYYPTPCRIVPLGFESPGKESA